MAIKSFGNALASFRYRFGRTGTSGGTLPPPPAPLSVTGGNVSFPYGGKTVHIWTSPGPFVVSGGPAPVEYFIVAGGGSGGADMGGGGGGGGVLEGTTNISGPFSASVTIGSGGNAYARNIPVPPDSSGSDSIVQIPLASPLVATGGGRGGYNAGGTEPGAPGGSGGGGYAQSSSTGGAGTPGQGVPGWARVSSPTSQGGGGGGAGEPGADVSAVSNAPGGRGKVIPATFRNPSYPYGGPAHPEQTSFSEGWYFGGGGAGGSPAPAIGYGGGGTQPGSGTGSPVAGENGTGGGGAGGPGSGGDPGGDGGNGIVFIAYPS